MEAWHGNCDWPSHFRPAAVCSLQSADRAMSSLLHDCVSVFFRGEEDRRRMRDDEDSRMEAGREEEEPRDGNPPFDIWKFKVPE